MSMMLNLATALFLSTPVAAAASQPVLPIDFASLSARYSIYPSTDGAQKRVREIVPVGLPSEAARSRLKAVGMSCGAIRNATLRCHYSTSVTVDALYIDPVIWVVTVHNADNTVRDVSVSVD